MSWTSKGESESEDDDDDDDEDEEVDDEEDEDDNNTDDSFELNKDGKLKGSCVGNSALEWSTGLKAGKSLVKTQTSW